MRPPVVAGLRAGAGASTLAAALHGVDAGVWSGGPVDVLVARPGRGPAALPGVAVLVLVGGDPAPAPGRPGEPVVLPVVPQWSGPGGVRAAADVLRTAEGATPVALRPAAAALRAVVAALLRSGVLDRPGPLPAPAGAPAPAAPDRAIAAAPVPVRRSPVVPVLLHRAVPVRPRLVAGAPLRWAPCDPTVPSPAGSGPPEPGRAAPSDTELGPAELRPAGPRPVQPRSAEPRPAERECAELPPPGPRSAGARPAQPRSAAPGPAERRSGEPRSGELRPAEPPPDPARPAEPLLAEPQPVPLGSAEVGAAGFGRVGPVGGLGVPGTARPPAPSRDGRSTPLATAPGPARAAERPHPSPDAPVRARTLRAGLVPAAGRSHDDRPIGARRRVAPGPALRTG